MNVLIVSFDKELVSKLKEALKEYNVVDVKNGEEAINTVSSFIDTVIYDAVAGSISEEDINNMYRSKFRDAKYIILVDDIFPVDMNNIIPPKKLKLARDEASDKIVEALFGDIVELPFQIEETLPPQGIPQSQEEGLALEKIFFEAEAEESLPFIQEPQVEEVPELGKKAPESPTLKKVLIVSFDSNLIGKLREVLSGQGEILEAKNMKEVGDKAREADIIIFDTILGMLARKTLMDMSKEATLMEKPYILLIDELFTIDVEDIPLKRKYTFARESELSKVVEKALELIREVPMELPAKPQETESVEEALPTIYQEEEKGIMSLLEEIIGAGVEEKEREVLPPVEEKKEELYPEKLEYVQQQPELESLAESISLAIRETIKSQLSQEMLYATFSQIIKGEEFSEGISKALSEKLESSLREQVQEALSKIDIAQIVREEAYKVLKERLKELIT
ncbi:MAG: hypothetical protein N2648_04800 [Aquificaceae bacterium]|nr:hypothetical protein [Aquificaceae bacterium]